MVVLASKLSRSCRTHPVQGDPMSERANVEVLNDPAMPEGLMVHWDEAQLPDRPQSSFTILVRPYFDYARNAEVAKLIAAVVTERESAEVAAAVQVVRRGLGPWGYEWLAEHHREGAAVHEAWKQHQALDSLTTRLSELQRENEKLVKAVSPAGTFDAFMEVSDRLSRLEEALDRTRQLADALMTVIEEAAATSVRDPEMAEILRDTLRKAEARRTALDSETKGEDRD